MANVLDEYTARVQEAVDSDTWLGRLFWYSVSDLLIPHQEFVAALNAAGITTGHPAPPKDSDVFKRVCSKVKHLKVPTEDPDVFENYKLTEFTDTTTITRRVVCEEVDNKGRRLDYGEVLDVTFDKAKGTMRFEPRGSAGNPNVAEQIKQEIRGGFRRERNCLNGYAVREWVRHFTLKTGATRVRPSGGVYFLTVTHTHTVEALEQLGCAISDWGDIDFHSLPLLDDRKQRQMVEKAYEADTVDAIDTVLAEITQLRADDKKISARKYAEMVTNYQDLVDRTKDYEAVLERKLANTDGRLTIFATALKTLRKQIKED